MSGFKEEQLKHVADDTKLTRESIDPSCKSYINLNYAPSGITVNEVIHTTSDGKFYKWNGAAWILIT